VLIRIDVKSGPWRWKSLAATIQENVDIQAFTLYNMGFKNHQAK
jgi:prolyl oligopeptidase